MPAIDQINGIKINVFNGEHRPPHIHAVYNEYEVLIVIESNEIYAGKLPGKQLKQVFEWLSENSGWALKVFFSIKSKFKMRQTIKIPRILKINSVKDLCISVVFNNGESRIIDFRKLFSDIGIGQNSPASVLFSAAEFEKVELQNNTLSWNNVEQFIDLKNGDQMKVPFEIGADVLLKYSFPEKTDLMMKIGKLVREARLKSGMTQQELAIISGTSRTYISRIENDRSDIELDTLRKIIETGLGKRLEIKIL